MTYHPLTKESGSDADNRRSEADKILDILQSEDVADFTTKEIEFLADCRDGREITVKMLFWLRDIKARFD
jgi:hypothetical protein